MTQQSQQLWSVIENILLIINKLWRQQHGRAVKRVFTSQIGGGDWVESKLTCGSILKPLPTVAGGNLPTFVVMIPKRKWNQSRWLN